MDPAHGTIHPAHGTLDPTHETPDSAAPAFRVEHANEAERTPAHRRPERRPGRAQPFPGPAGEYSSACWPQLVQPARDPRANNSRKGPGEQDSISS